MFATLGDIAARIEGTLVLCAGRLPEREPWFLARRGGWRLSEGRELLNEKSSNRMAGTTGLERVASAVTELRE